MIKVSIIIPVYKVEKYIERCLRSVMAQTYQGEIECILVDDCTPDRSMQLVEQILSSYIGNIEFKIVRHEKNKGLSAARNTGIKIASGEYLYFLDSDDEITPDAIESLEKFTEIYPDVEIVQGNLYASSDFQWLFVKPSLPVYCCDHRSVKKMMLRLSGMPSTSWNKLIKTSFLLQHELWFPEGLIHEDEYWNFFAAKYTCSLAINKDPTYIYYKNESSIVNTISDVSIRSLFLILELFLKNIDRILVRQQFKVIMVIWMSLWIKVSVDNDFTRRLERKRYLRNMLFSIWKSSFGIRSVTNTVVIQFYLFFTISKYTLKSVIIYILSKWFQ